MSRNLWILALALLLLPLGMVNAIDFTCGDGICSVFDAYNETNSSSIYYCPRDCGADMGYSSRWCEDTYTLRAGDCPTCPTCGGCASCDTSRVPTSDLANWCTSNGYTSTSALNSACGGDTAGNEPDVWIWWLIFLIIGLVLGYIIWGKKKKRGK